LGKAAPRSTGVWLGGWAALLLLVVGLASLDAVPSSLRPVLAPGRLAVTLGFLLLSSIALILPLRGGGPVRFLEDLSLTLVLAAPVAVAAWDWTPITPALAGPFLAILASQAVLGAAASWAGVGRHGRTGSIYLVAVVLVLFGAPFLSYMLSEMSMIEKGGWRFVSAIWAARPLLLDRPSRLPPGFWTPAVGANLILAAGFAVRAVLRRGGSA
jgi:hypothetical protein